ncbi:hypothetical protein ABW20_dc0102476 [Dactylellina cionopaga]|nr:hypothetical protein ABW20_dc0102476 [Dactylellina cionopaga]
MPTAISRDRDSNPCSRYLSSSTSDATPIPQENPRIRLFEGWRKQPELKCKLIKLPEDVTTLDLWSFFSPYGSIEAVEIDENRGMPTGVAFIRFRPPPNENFWDEALYLPRKDGTRVKFQAILQALTMDFTVTSPVNPKIKYPERMELPVKKMDFGFMVQEETMMSMYTLESLVHKNSKLSVEITFEVNLRRKELNIRFTVPFKTTQGKPKLRREKYLVRIPFIGLEGLYDTLCDRSDERLHSILIPLQHPPQIWRKMHNTAQSHQKSGQSRRWTEWDSWLRKTDIIENEDNLQLEPLAIRKTKPTIDIGRWTTYKFSFELDAAQNNEFDLILRALKDFNIPMLQMPTFKLSEDQNLPVWDVIDPPSTASEKTWLGHIEHDYKRKHLPYHLRYQLEACISQGCISEYNMSEAFIQDLLAMEEIEKGMAVRLLESIVDKGKRFYDPMDIFREKRPSRTRQRIPSHCGETRKATVTPTMIYYANPTVETTNRVIRHYIQHEDRFLRVQFTDEKLHGKISATEEQNSNDLFTRVMRALRNGIIIGDRHFKFLAFGNSQLRQHGAYFFAEGSDLTCDDIRQWMGRFDNIKVIAKYAARLGQCFSTTRAIHGFKVKDIDIPDVERNGHCFTDGCGTISQSAAQLIAAEFGPPKGEPTPSCFQFRLSGCKGVLAVDPNLKRGETSDASFQICIRPSQRKFEAEHNILEIIKCSTFSVATLNRQLIAVLSDLGLDDQIFLDKLRDQLSSLRDAMTEPRMALNLLRKFIDPNQATLRIARLILDGFMKTKEPFLQCLLHLWRAWSIKMLKEKARIAVENSCFLLGVVDETATLKGHFSNEHRKMKEIRDRGGPLRVDLLPEIFVQIPDPDNKGLFNVVEGPCLLARNPSLHPGDLRIVNAVDCPKLRHLRNVVVLPQTGERPIANMCSGGDLDGDDFIVIWDGAFLPPKINEEPMDYSPPIPVEAAGGRVTINDISTFFVSYMKNDTLGTIANAHLAATDYLAQGIFSPQCIELAGLHSLAVDFPKTGVSAKMRKDLRVKKWPHFFEKQLDNPNRVYRSDKILGQLYDAVDRVAFKPEECMKDLKFDDRILKAFGDIDSKMLSVARDLKSRYDDALRRIMGQHEIKTEFEVWSTFVLSHVQFTSDYKFHEEIGDICNTLLERFEREVRVEIRTEDEYSIGRFAAAMYIATNREYARAVAKEGPLPLISFPWIFANLLGKIAEGQGVFERDPSTGLCQIPTADVATRIPYHIENKPTKKGESEKENTEMQEEILDWKKVEDKGENWGQDDWEEDDWEYEEKIYDEGEENVEEDENDGYNEKRDYEKEKARWGQGLPRNVAREHQEMTLEELLSKPLSKGTKIQEISDHED